MTIVGAVLRLLYYGLHPIFMLYMNISISICIYCYIVKYFDVSIY